jgi:hypothetical protein
LLADVAIVNRNFFGFFVIFRDEGWRPAAEKSEWERKMAPGLLPDTAMGVGSIMMITGLVAGFLLFGLFLAMLSSSPRTPR